MQAAAVVVKNVFRRHRKQYIGLIILSAFLLLLSGGFSRYIKKVFGEIKLKTQMEEELQRKEVKALIEEFRCFPLRDTKEFYYENGYGTARTYGGKRKHEGIDLIPKDGKENVHPVVSASDGIVEQIGWLKLGGYRVGIRSETGFYYYYAHLASYAKGLRKGKKIRSGELLGYMGSTGYGTEGTRGKFVCHLHFGIYRQVEEKEKSLNPYYLLRFKENG